MKKLSRNILIILLIFILGLMSTSCKNPKNNNEEDNSDRTEETNEVIGDKKDSYITKLEAIAKQIVDNDGESVQNILNQAYVSHGDLVENIYYADATGKMLLSPPLQLPEDYDARERPWYKNALGKELHQPAPFQDASIEKNIQTIAKALYKEEQLIGVIGMDYELKNNQTIKNLNQEDNSIEIGEKKTLLSVEKREKLEKYIEELSHVVETEDDLEVLKKYFDEQLKKGIEGVETIYLANKKEVLLISPYVQLPDNYDPSVRLWYKKAQNKSIYVSDTFVDAENDEITVTVSKKVELENDSIGILGIDFIIEL